jgi:tetratricopeptide (TPR) repeat protein
LFGQCLANGVSETADAAPRLGAGVLLLTALAAVALPAVYAAALIDSQTKKAEELLQGMRLARVQGVVQGLCDLGSTTPLADLSPATLRAQIGQTLQAYQAIAARPLPEPASPPARLDRARVLAILDRPVEAIRHLTPLAESDPAATLLLAAVFQDQQRWEESSRRYRQALTMLAAAPSTEAAALAGRVKAYNGLAFNARACKAYQEAEAVYQEALNQLPAAQAHFHFQLGRHYQSGGRPGKAIEHLQTAARLDPNFAEPARPLIEEMTAHTPSCFLRWQGP